MLWVSQDSSVSVGIHYKLDVPGIEFQCGRDFPHPSKPTLGLTQPPIKWVLDLFPRGKGVGVWHWPPTPT